MMVIFVRGADISPGMLEFSPTGTLASLSTTSIPSMTLPNAAYRPSREVASSCMIKNCMSDCVTPACDAAMEMTPPDVADVRLLEGNLFASRSVAIRVPALDHEALHDPMEGNPIVFATRDVLKELGDGPGGLVPIEFKLDRAHARLQRNVLIAERLWGRGLLEEGEHEQQRQNDRRCQYNDHCPRARRNGLSARILLLQFLRPTEFRCSLLLVGAHLWLYPSQSSRDFGR